MELNEEERRWLYQFLHSKNEQSIYYAPIRKSEIICTKCGAKYLGHQTMHKDGCMFGSMIMRIDLENAKGKRKVKSRLDHVEPLDFID